MQNFLWAILWPSPRADSTNSKNLRCWFNSASVALHSFYNFEQPWVLEEGPCATHFYIMIFTIVPPSFHDEQNYWILTPTYIFRAVLQLADQLVQRITALHSRSIIHRDIKPVRKLLLSPLFLSTYHISPTLHHESVLIDVCRHIHVPNWAKQCSIVHQSWSNGWW